MTADRHDRRAFFRQFLRRVVEPAVELAEKVLPFPPHRAFLRPPGALAERAFLDTCYRCGNCADVCPAQAIFSFRGADEELRGTPFIDPGQQPCLVCDGLQCMHACPSGALRPVPLEQIRMGLAQVNEQTCVRSQGEDCRKCVEICPLGEKAIRLDADGWVEVLAHGCIGCGICQRACPTSPAAIAVRPF
jgi:MauM/NapG family ferredoxin protein